MELARAAVERHSSIHSTVPPPDPGRARLVASRLIRTAPLNWACACMPGCSAKQSQNCSKTCVFYTINSCNSGFHFCNNVRCNIIRLNTVYLIVMYLKTRIMTSKSRRKKKRYVAYLSYADLDHTCRNPTRHDVIDFDPPQCRVSSLCLPIFQALHRKSWDALIHLAGNESWSSLYCYIQRKNSFP